MLEILEAISAESVVYIATLGASGTIMTCWLLATALGHVRLWPPVMISDCAVEAPEKYLFRMGLIPSAVLLQLNSVLMLYFLQNTQTKQSLVFDKVCVALATIACTGLAAVGAINEQEDNPVHSACAVVFFFLFEAYMILISARLFPYCSFSSRCRGEPMISNSSILTKIALTGYNAVALSCFIYLSGDWGTNQPYIAVCEWTGTMSIIAFNMTYVMDFKQALNIEAIYSPNGTNNNSVDMSRRRLNAY